MTSKESSETLQSKYYRLGVEFKKLREKHIILKQALLEEREQLKTLQCKHRELEIRQRQFDQERESLQFRNEHLSKQVDYLQLQLETERHSKKIQKKKHDGVGGGGAGCESDNLKLLLEEELQNKIEECCRLHRKLSDITTQSDQSQLALNEEIERLQRQLATEHEELENVDRRHAKTIETINDEKSALEVKVIFLEREVRQLQDMVKTMNITPKENNIVDHSSDLTECKDSTTIQENELVDLHNIVVNKLKECVHVWNVVLVSWEELITFETDTGAWQKWRDCALSLLGRVEGLSVFWTPHNGAQWSYESFVEVTKYIIAFCDIGDDLFIPMLQSAYQDEFNRKNDVQLRARNGEIADCVKRFVDLMRQIYVQLTLLTADNENVSCNENTDGLVNIIYQIGCVIKDIGRRHKSKMDLLETLSNGELPNETQKKQFRQLIENLYRLKDRFSDLETTLRSKCVILHCSVAFMKNFMNKSFNNGLNTPSSRGSNTPSLHSRYGFLSPPLVEMDSPSKRMEEDNYIKEQSNVFHQVKKEEEEYSVYSLNSGDYSVHSRLANNNTSIDKRISSLLERLGTLESRVLEQSVRAQIAEQQLKLQMQIREKLLKKLVEQGINFHDIVLPDNSSELPLLINSPSLNSTDISSTLTIATINHKETLRENLLMRSYHEHCQRFHAQLELIHAELLHYQDETANLQTRIKIEEAQRGKLALVIEQLNAEISKLKEDLECTQENYSDQLSGMHDHITSLNKQLSDQDRLLDQYKAQSTRKSLFSIKK